MNQVQPSPGGTVIAFRSGDHKTRRPAAPKGEERGAILLFTGVRYDRMQPEPASLAAPGEKAELEPGRA